MAVFAPRMTIFDGLYWNWQGKTLEALSAILMMLVLRLDRQVVGFTLPKNSLGLVSALGMASIIWSLNLYALATGDRVPDELATTESVAFQLTLPGIAEEIVYRGILWAICDQVFGRPWRILGADLGLGWIFTSLLFWSVHFVQVSKTGSLSFSADWQALIPVALTGFILGWIRAKTESVYPAMIAHNVANGIMFVGSML